MTCKTIEDSLNFADEPRPRDAEETLLRWPGGSTCQDFWWVWICAEGGKMFKMNYATKFMRIVKVNIHDLIIVYSIHTSCKAPDNDGNVNGRRCRSERKRLLLREQLVNVAAWLMDGKIWQSETCPSGNLFVPQLRWVWFGYYEDCALYSRWLE